MTITCAACDSDSDELGGDDESDGGGEDLGKHHAIPLSQLPGYRGPNQQWCFCGAKCTFCCAACSTADYVLACHQMNAPVHGGRRSCILEHAADPKKHPLTYLKIKDKADGRDAFQSPVMGPGKGGRGRGGAGGRDSAGRHSGAHKRARKRSGSREQAEDEDDE